MASSVAKGTRLQAVDALRGFDMFWIIGGERLFAALMVLTGWQWWQLLADQMQHSSWHGLTFYDLIFPLFIFLSGVTLGLQRRNLSGLSWSQRAPVYRKALQRVGLLLLLGVLYNHGWGTGIPADPEAVRYASVLGRIAIAWLLAALIAWHLPLRGQMLLAAAIAVTYAAVQGGWGPQPYSDAGSINAWLDQTLLPGATYRNAPLDPEGLWSHISASLNALAGVWAGYWLRSERGLAVKLQWLVLASLLLWACGWGLDGVIPVNKPLWTLSFVLVTVAASGLLLALFVGLIDGFGWRRFGHCWALIGVNSIAIYLASSWFNWQYLVDSLTGGWLAALPAQWSPLLAVIVLLALQWGLLNWLWRRQIIIKV